MRVQSGQSCVQQKTIDDLNLILKHLRMDSEPLGTGRSIKRVQIKDIFIAGLFQHRLDSSR